MESFKHVKIQGSTSLTVHLHVTFVHICAREGANQKVLQIT